MMENRQFWRLAGIVLTWNALMISAETTETSVFTLQAEGNGRIDLEVMEVISTTSISIADEMALKESFSSLLKQTTHPQNQLITNTSSTQNTPNPDKYSVFLDLDSAASTSVETKLVSKITEENITRVDGENDQINGTKPVITREVVTEISVQETKDGQIIKRKPTDEELLLAREDLDDSDKAQDIEDLSSFLGGDPEDDMFDESWHDEDEGESDDPHDMESILKEEHSQVTTESYDKEKENSSEKEPGDYRKIYHTERKNFTNLKEYKIMISETEGDFFDDDDFPEAAFKGQKLNETNAANNTKNNKVETTTSSTIQQEDDSHMQLIKEMMGRNNNATNDTLTKQISSNTKLDDGGNKTDDTASSMDNHLEIIKDLLEELNSEPKLEVNETETTQASVITEDNKLAPISNEISKQAESTTTQPLTETISNNIIETTTLTPPVTTEDNMAENGVSVQDLSEIISLIDHKETLPKVSTEIPLSVVNQEFSPDTDSVTTPPWAEDILKEYEMDTGGHDDFPEMDTDFMTTSSYSYFDKFMKEMSDLNNPTTTRTSLTGEFTSQDDVTTLPSTTEHTAGEDLLSTQTLHTPYQESVEITTTTEPKFEITTARNAPIEVATPSFSYFDQFLKEMADLNRATTTIRSFLEAFTSQDDVITTEHISHMDSPASEQEFVETTPTTQPKIETTTSTEAPVTTETNVFDVVPSLNSLPSTPQDDYFHGLSPSDVAAMFNPRSEEDDDSSEEEDYDNTVGISTSTPIKESSTTPKPPEEDPKITGVLAVISEAEPVFKATILNNTVQLTIKISNKNETFYVPKFAHVSEFGNIVNITWRLKEDLNNSVAFKVFDRGQFYMIKEIITNLFMGMFNFRG
ncbi:enolase-phosphatase E1-like [Euwallacea similis]|uniref:enolase-phosphatase E1-like n=1 Tax=Euwallacea similis TaxID=1736056 RepID=UPI00344FEEF7